MKTPICDRLGIAWPIFGFSHSVEVVAAVAEAGGFGVLGLAREMPGDIPALIAQADERLGGRPFGIDLMLPSKVPQIASIGNVRESLPADHVTFVSGLRERFRVQPPTQPSFFTTQVRSEALFEAQIEAVLASRVCAVATAIGLRADLIERARAGGKLTMSLIGAPHHAQKALGLGVDVLVAQGYDAGGHTGEIGTFSLLPQIVALAGDVPVLAAGGIGTGEQIAAAIAMGAQGGWLGTPMARSARKPYAARAAAALDRQRQRRHPHHPRAQRQAVSRGAQRVDRCLARSWRPRAARHAVAAGLDRRRVRRLARTRRRAPDLRGGRAERVRDHGADDCCESDARAAARP